MATTSTTGKEPVIVQREAFHLVGVRIRTTPMAEEIPALWQAFVPRMREIVSMAEPRVSYGLMENFDPVSVAFDYVAAMSVLSVDLVPDGLEALTVAAGLYARFDATLGTLGEVFGVIFRKWPLAGRYEQTRSPYFERYGPAFDQVDPGSPVEIYIPVRELAIGVGDGR